MGTDAIQLTLGQLIARMRAGRTYDELAAAGGGIPGAPRWYTLERKPMKAFPDRATILGLAQGLDVPVRTVLLAIARSLDLPLTAEPERLIQVLPPSASRLTDEQIVIVGSLVRQMTGRSAE